MTYRQFLTAICICSAVAGLTSCSRDVPDPPSSEQIGEARQRYDATVGRRPSRQPHPADIEETNRDLAAHALARIGQPAVPYLVEGLGDADPHVRARTAKVLGRMGPAATGATAQLTAALEDTDDAVRRAAAHALGQIGPDAAPAVPGLIQLLHAPEPESDGEPTVRS